MGIIRRIKKVVFGRNPDDNTADVLGGTGEIHDLSDLAFSTVHASWRGERGWPRALARHPHHGGPHLCQPPLYTVCAHYAPSTSAECVTAIICFCILS